LKVKLTEATYPHTDPKPVGRVVVEGAHNQPEFEVAFRNTMGEKRKQLCAELLTKLDEQSAALKKSPSIAGIRQYRQLVKEFMEEALANSYQVESGVKWDYSGNRRQYVIVKNINQSLEEITEVFLNQEKAQIDLVAKLDEIRGMLVDLFF
jgi:uncharacterized protein YaaR (DUF327 family)